VWTGIGVVTEFRIEFSPQRRKERKELQDLGFAFLCVFAVQNPKSAIRNE